MDSSSSFDEDAAVSAVLNAIESVCEESAELRPWGGGKFGRRPNLKRGECKWWDDYLSSQSIYPPSLFRRRFRVPLKLFRRLLHDLPAHEPTLKQLKDAVGRLGATSWQKILVSLRRLSLGASYDSLDDQARMSSESVRRAVRAFCKAVCLVYGGEFLNRAPSLQELRAIESSYARKMLPGCTGSVDCMAVKWKNCPKSWKGQYHNPRHGKLASVSVEALCDSNLYCWHVFVGQPGTNNDITVSESSPLFVDILTEARRMRLPEGYTLNAQQRSWYLYYLVDGIYPEWAIFAKPIHEPSTHQKQVMTTVQESRRKDVERLFGVLQGRFQILKGDFHLWSDTEVSEIVHTCVILHNMLIRLSLGGELHDEEDTDGSPMLPDDIVQEFYYDTIEHEEQIENEPHQNAQTWMETLIGVDESVRSRFAHIQLREALVSHIWNQFGHQQNT